MAVVPSLLRSGCYVTKSVKQTVLIPRVPQPTVGGSSLVRELARCYDRHDIRLQLLHTPVNDVFAVTAAEGTFACKLYHRNRGAAAVDWEIDLLLHMRLGGAPVVPPIRGQNGYLVASGLLAAGCTPAIWVLGSAPTSRGW
jgi:hypothetical protein